MGDSVGEPILASTLYLAHEEPGPQLKLATGLSGLDEMLSGGFAHGCMSCISAAKQNSTVKELTLQLLMQRLTASIDPDTDATLIDTNLSFDVRGFYQRVLAVLRERNEADADAQAMAVLKRLRIMKTFDFLGLVECVTELKDDLEHVKQAHDSKGSAPKGTIADSQGEDVIAELDGAPPFPQDTSDFRRARGKGLLIIDNITQPVLAQLKPDHIQGRAVLSSLLRNLRHLTVTHDFVTILMNTTIEGDLRTKEDPLSIFTSCTLRPALGRTFAGALDLHLLVHDVPIDEASARLVYGERKGVGDCVSVLEILQDRLDGKVGRWVSCKTRHATFNDLQLSSCPALGDHKRTRRDRWRFDVSENVHELNIA
nr:hypothetical protein CFP56_42116 [Quercus suber]